MPMVPLFGLGTGRKSPNVSKQARVNMYAEKAAEPDKGPLAFYARPGLQHLDLNASGGIPVAGAARGMIAVQTNNGQPVVPFDVLIVFCGAGVNVCKSLGSIEGVTSVDPYPGLGPVRSAFDGFAVVAVDGVIGHYVSIPSGLNFKIPDTNFPSGARTVCFLSGRFFCDDPSNPGRFRWSDIYNGQSWPALNYATAETSPDTLTGVFEARGQLLLFGTRTLEFWNPAPTGYAGQQPVQLVSGAVKMWGTEAYDTIRKVGENVCFLGRNNNGDRKVILLDGYNATPISTPDIERDIQSDPSPDSATAGALTKAGHTFYVLNLSARSWAYDLETGNWDIWHTEGSRFAGQWVAACYGQLLVTDYRDQRLHLIDVNNLTDDGAIMVREIISRHLFGPDLEFLPVSQICIDMETGVGLVSGQGSNPMIMLQWSKDGGHTWGNEIWQTFGALGNYLTRAVWRFLGVARDWTFKLRITDPVTVAIIAANMKVGK